MADPVDVILQFHDTASFGTHENMLARSREVNEAYGSLTERQVAEVVSIALAGDDPDETLACLACLRPDSLKPFQQEFIEREVYYPGVIYHGADEACATLLAERIVSSGDALATNHLLQCTAWVANGTVCRLFSEWRDAPPAWAGGLHVPPHTYSEEAGWELPESGSSVRKDPSGAATGQGTASERRELYFRTTLPLLRPEDCPEPVAGVDVFTAAEGRCQWCGRQLVSLLELDLTCHALSFVQWDAAQLRVAACDVCAMYGTVFSRSDAAGASRWHPRNVRPPYLPDGAAQWAPLPQRPLVLTGTHRHHMQSAVWTVPGALFSQVGGLPTWIGDAEYPHCPDCGRTMVFLGQISNEEYDHTREGIFHCFICSGCRVTAASYQQS